MAGKANGMNRGFQITRGKARQVSGDVAVNRVWVLARLPVGNTLTCPETHHFADGLVGPGSSPGENGACETGVFETNKATPRAASHD